jgi:hypothetical protein
MSKKLLARFAPSAFVALLSAGFAGTGTAQSISAQGYLPRDLGNGEFKLTIDVTGVPDALHLRGAVDDLDEQQELEQRLQVFFPRDLLGHAVHYDAQSAIADNFMPIYMTLAQPHTETQAADGTWSYEYQLEIQQALPGSFGQIICGMPDCTSPELPMVAMFFLGTGTGGDPIAVLDPPQLLTQSE